MRCELENMFCLINNDWSLFFNNDWNRYNDSESEEELEQDSLRQLPWINFRLVSYALAFGAAFGFSEYLVNTALQNPTLYNITAPITKLLDGSVSQSVVLVVGAVAIATTAFIIVRSAVQAFQQRGSNENDISSEF